MTKEQNKPIERLRGEIYRALDSIEEQLKRLEILTGAMTAFSRPIPDYDMSFQHQRQLTASATVLRRSR